jgi:prepilin-type N-terminal cleavage/methylation domain-containing protein/prepilin-type processing-associated H-X9-DG protein
MPRRRNAFTLVELPAVSKRGFTLVELLVVIGIIALLISMLLPALNKARASAVTVQCAAKLRQIGNAFSLYENAYGGWSPAARPALPKTRNADGTLNWGGAIDYPGWHSFLVPMLKRTNNSLEDWSSLFECPVQADIGRPFHSDYTLQGFIDTNSGVKLKWGAQNWSPSNSSEYWEGSSVWTRTAGKASHPHETARAFDGPIETWAFSNFRQPYYVQPNTDSSGASFFATAMSPPNASMDSNSKLRNRIDYRHGSKPGYVSYAGGSGTFRLGLKGVANVLFLDGHVESMPPFSGTPQDTARWIRMRSLR